jgi:hypothetical protein
MEPAVKTAGFFTPFLAKLCFMTAYLCAVFSYSYSRVISITIIGVLLSCAAFAQNVRVFFKVVGPDSMGVPYAVVKVTDIADTTLRTGATADSVGKCYLMLQPTHRYTVTTSALGYVPATLSVLVADNNPVYTLAVVPDARNLKDVTVVARRPLMRQEDDKTIVDPTDLAMASTSAFDIIEKVPGLFVDQDGNIYISSSTPASVYINGREQKMGRAEVAALLRSLPPNSIERIEIMRLPSTRYDASSSGGVVNVVLKKGVKPGLTGSANTGFNQGVYGNQFAGVVINNDNGKLSTSFNVQASRRNNGERIKTDRTFSGDSLLSQDAYTVYPANSYYGSYTVGYNAGKKWDITIDGRASYNESHNSSSSPAGILVQGTAIPAATYTTDVANNNSSVSVTQGLSTKYKPDTSGTEWTTDLSWNYLPGNAAQQYNTAYGSPTAFTVSGNGDVATRLHSFTAQTDYVKKLPHRATAEVGLKATNVWFTSNTDYTRTVGGATSPDAQRTNAYSYNEHIYAAYLQGTKKLGSVLLKTGLRFENTNMDGHQTIPADTTFGIKRSDFFPYLYVSRKVMAIAGYELRAFLIARRTITRPAYEYLNPFPRYVDQYLSEMGNPSLRPQFTNNYEANVSVDDRPIVAVGYNEMTDMFSQVVYQAAGNSRQTYRTYDNLGSNREWYVRGLGAIPPGRTYFFVIGGQYNHNVYNGVYNGLPLSYTRGSWSFFTYQTLKLSKTTQLVLNGFMRYKGLVQFYELSTFGALNLSVNQQFFDRKMKVTLSVTDMFFTNKNTFAISQGNVTATGLRQNDTRRIGMNIIYNFGVRKKEDNNFLKQESPENAR